MTELEKAAALGQPSFVWRAGQERRLQMILEAAAGRELGSVLDNGCGVGAYLERLAPGAVRAFGLEFDRGRAAEARGRSLEILSAHGRSLEVLSARGERLPFRDSVFDLILSHEVIEHVDDDRAAVAEMVRALRPPSGETSGGRLVLFVPNRGYPFETHGIYWRGKYRFGNFPLVNYLPRTTRDRLAPHVRVYSARDLERLFEGLPVRVVRRTAIFGAYDNIIARWPIVGRTLRSSLQALERTPLRAVGLSHFWVLERVADA
ncbi:MAG: class I SAM-dependent methyltransferase [Anaerolineales bacterium]